MDGDNFLYNPFRLLSTKPLDALTASTAARLQMQCTELALMQTRPLLVQEETGWWANGTVWAFTSAAAVASMKPVLSGEKAVPPIVAVGARVEAAIQRIRPGTLLFPPAPNARTLGEQLCLYHRLSPVHQLVFFCGIRRLNHLHLRLNTCGVPITEVYCYESFFTPAADLPDTEAVLFFSPSGAEAYLQIRRPLPHCIAVAIGPTTAAALMPTWPGPVLTAEQTSALAMLQILDAHLKSIKFPHAT